jgi:phospholipase C
LALGLGDYQMPEIEHVIVLVLENRSFDHMLGYLDHSEATFDGLTQNGPYTNPGWKGAAPIAATPTAGLVGPIGPDHSHDGVMEQLALDAARNPTNQGFVASLERKGRGLRPPEHGGLLGSFVDWCKRTFVPHMPGVEGLGPIAMRCQPMANVPVLQTLALEFAVCTRWFSSVPGETWPNRNFLHAATSDGETNINVRPYLNPTIFELLECHANPALADPWHIYYDDTPQVWAFPNLWDTPERHARWYPFDDFAEHVAAGKLPAYSFIEPNHRPPVEVMDDASGVFAPGLSDNQHPENNLGTPGATGGPSGDSGTDFQRAETLIARVYQALRGNRTLFEHSLLLVTYDEHGGFYDHRPPVEPVPSPGTTQGWFTRLLRLFWYRKAAHFGFTMLGPRVPAVVISPFVEAGTIDCTTRDHSCVPKTVRAIFAPEAADLTKRDAWAVPFHTLLTRETPRDDLPDLSFAIPSPAPALPIGIAATPMVAAPEGSVSATYAPYVEQAKRVHQELQRLGEPEALAPLTGTTDAAHASAVASLFACAAARHREELASTLT